MKNRLDCNDAAISFRVQRRRISKNGFTQFPLACQMVPATCDLSGSYDGMLKFLSSLEQYVRLMNVDTIQATTSSQQPGVLQFSIRADAYFLK